MIVKAALELIHEQGMEALNARSLAARLDCSVQPIFRNFESIDDLKTELVRQIADNYRNYLENSVSLDDQMMGLVLAYVRYAREEKQYFRLLQMSDRYKLKDLAGASGVSINKSIIDEIARMVRISNEKAAELYWGCFFTAHGMASMIATNQCEFSDKMVQDIMNSVFEGMLMRARAEQKQD